MAGYDGFSMSNNARAAYRNGRMPASKLAKELGLAFVLGRSLNDNATAGVAPATKGVAEK